MSCLPERHPLNAGAQSGPFLVSRTGDAGMNRTLGYGAGVDAEQIPGKVLVDPDSRDGGHGSRNPLRSV